MMHSTTDARLLAPKGSQDDSSLDLGEGTSAAALPPAPQSAPKRLVSSPAKAATHPDSPIRPQKPSVKGKEKAWEPTESFLKRLAGPSTGKAGLLRDPEEVRKIIWEASKGSKFAENERKRDEATTAQVTAMLDRLETKLKAKRHNLAADEREMELRAQVLEAERHLDQTVVVVDADAFYASVEELLDPSLKGKAFGVGSGVLTTASYEARRYGCRSAMAGFVAKKLCPNIIFVKPKFSEYSAASHKVMNVLRDYDAQMAPASLDEAYLNITAHLVKTGQTATEVVSEMRARVKAETGLTVSAGVGPAKFIAKIAADVNKPDGQCIVPPTRQDVLDFLHKMSVRKIPGIGRVTERWLEAVDVKTVGDIWTHRGKLNVLREEMNADWLLRKYLGLGSAVVEPSKREDRKSVGCEETFSTIWKEQDLFDQLRQIADSLAGDLERLRFSGRTITLKLKLDTYELLSRAHTSGPSIFYSSADELYKVGKTLLDKELASRYKAFDSGQPVQGCKGVREMRLRLMGLRATNLRDEDAGSKTATVKNALSSWITANAAPAPLHHAIIEINSDTDDDQSAEPRPKRPANGGLLESRPPKKTKSSVKLISSSDQALSNVSCPTCERLWQETSLAHFNSHLDRCLATSLSSGSKNNSASTSARTTSSNAFGTLMSGKAVASKKRKR